jgi:acetyl-CoA carboxylase biotin carboxyl carrier protein
MPERELIALLSRDDTETTLRSPTVGRFSGLLPQGAGVVPGQVIGRLAILGHVYQLLAPDTARGVVIQRHLDEGLHPVEYGQPLYRLGAPSSTGPTLDEPHGAETAAETGPTGDRIAVRAPTTGVFYRRPDPQSPPYVELGQIVELGRPLGLVEVMKCFNQIRYEGHGMPPRARIVAIPVEDNAEIELGQVLFLLEPA